jgi:hypothetical protein
MAVIIRKSGYAWTWTCTTPVRNTFGLKRCNHSAVAATEAEARAAYERHKKTTAGH